MGLSTRFFWLFLLIALNFGFVGCDLLFENLRNDEELQLTKQTVRIVQCKSSLLWDSLKYPYTRQKQKGSVLPYNFHK